MEFFLPGVCLLLVSVLVTYLISPHLTPIITAILSIVFLVFGVYSHYHMFASEYRLSTWQEGLKIYAPAVMIIAIILFIIYGIIALFTGVKVPVPAMPTIELPAVNTLTNSMMKAYNNVANNVSHITNDKPTNNTNHVNNALHAVNTAVNNVVNNVAKHANNMVQAVVPNQPRSGTGRSIVETI